MYIEGISKETEERNRFPLQETLEIMKNTLEGVSKQNPNEVYQIRMKRFAVNPPSEGDFIISAKNAESIQLDPRGRITFHLPRRLRGLGKILGERTMLVYNSPGEILIEKINEDGTTTVIDSAILIYGQPNHEVYKLGEI
jgi:hypothetical protein